MTTQNDPDMTQVEALLRQARAQKPEVPDALMARVLADAEAVQPKAGAQPVASRASPWEQLRAALGGWQGMGGLAAATCAGFWIGVNPPAGLPDAGAFLLGVQSEQVVSESAAVTGFGWDLEEG